MDVIKNITPSGYYSINNITPEERLKQLAELYNDIEFQQDNEINRKNMQVWLIEIEYLINEFPSLKQPYLKNYNNKKQ